MNFVKSSMVASIVIAAINTGVAASYSHTGLYNIQLDTIDSVGSQPLVASPAPVLSSSTEVGTNYDRVSTTYHGSTSVIESDISIQPEVGVPGQIDFYYVTTQSTTTETYDQDFKKEGSSIDYSGSVAEQTSGSAYTLNASMQRNAEQGVLEYTASDSLSIYTGMTVHYTGSEYISGSMFGELTINYTDGIDSWTTNHQQEFIFDPNNYMSLNFSDYYNFDDTISFEAIFEVYGTDLSYSITDLWLNAGTYASEYGPRYNIRTDTQTTETARILVGSEELPALPEPVTAVPVPAAMWLFGSGLIALAGFARRKQ